MAQREVLNCLKGKGWIDSDEIHRLLPFISKQSINESLRRLAKGKYVDCKKDKESRHGFLYRVN